MDWQDEGMLLTVRRHGETSAIIEVLTAAHGRHAGLIRGARSKALAPVLQPGVQLSLEWRARLADHLGHYRVEPIRQRAGAILDDRLALAGLTALTGLVSGLLPEREPDGPLYDVTIALADRMAGADPGWPAAYARWELALLAALGFGLDLSACAATGQTDALVFVSPRTGRAVSREAGRPFAPRLLPLPAFLVAPDDAPTDPAAVVEALRTTGWFLEHRVAPALDRDRLPESRQRLLQALQRAS